MLPTKIYVDQPKSKSAIALTKIILKICTFSKKKHDFTRKKQQINLNFEFALNNSVIMLPTKNYVDRPKTKSAITLTKIILKICTFSKKKQHDFTRKKQQINLNFELALNNSVIMLPTNNYVDRPKTKSAIALTKIILKICIFFIKNIILQEKNNRLT